jgi:hypothetical protein
LRDEEFASYVRAVVQSLSEAEAEDGSMSPSIPVLLYNNSVRNGSGPSCAAMAQWYRAGWIGGVKVRLLAIVLYNRFAISLQSHRDRFTYRFTFAL